MKKNPIRTVICVCLIALLLIGGAAYGAVRYVDGRIQQLNQARITDTGAVTMAAENPISQIANLQLNPRSGELLDPTEIYELATQQVVGISTEVTSANAFGQMVTGAISGTGFIISSDGYILTNNHVVEKAYKDNLKVTVMLYDGTEYEAQIIGVEGDNNDIAVLKIEASGLNAATLGNSDDMKVGESVYLVGNPLGELTYTMTAGIISALDREIAAEQDASVNMFQLDAAVNSGNSGGPVYNSRGQVIGVITAKYKSTGVEGLGFAIPINDAAVIADEIIDHGYVTGKPYFGIMVKTMTEQYAAYYNSVPGVYVYSVDAGSCAASAGIRQGDVITKLGDEEIKTNADLSTAKKAYKAGDTAEVTVFRSGEYLTLKVTFDEKKPDRRASEVPEDDQPAESTPEPAPGGEGGGQSIWDFFFGQIIPKGNEEPQETPAPDGEGAPGHFGS